MCITAIHSVRAVLYRKKLWRFLVTTGREDCIGWVKAQMPLRHEFYA